MTPKPRQEFFAWPNLNWGTKVSELPRAQSLHADDLVLLSQRVEGKLESRKVTLRELKNYLG